MKRLRRLRLTWSSVASHLSDVYERAVEAGDLKLQLEAIKTAGASIRGRHGMQEMETLIETLDEAKRVIRDRDSLEQKSRDHLT